MIESVRARDREKEREGEGEGRSSVFFLHCVFHLVLSRVCDHEPRWLSLKLSLENHTGATVRNGERKTALERITERHTHSLFFVFLLYLVCGGHGPAHSAVLSAAAVTA